jgi:hypothetical protein
VLAVGELEEFPSADELPAAELVDVPELVAVPELVRPEANAVPLDEPPPHAATESNKMHAAACRSPFIDIRQNPR